MRYQQKSMPAASKSFGNLPKSSKSLIFLQFSSKPFLFSRNFSKILPDPEDLLRDLSGGLRDLSAGLRSPRPVKKSSDWRWPEKSVPGAWKIPKIIFPGMHGFRIPHPGCFWITIRSQVSSTEWQFWVPSFPPSPRLAHWRASFTGSHSARPPGHQWKLMKIKENQ